MISANQIGLFQCFPDSLEFMRSPTAFTLNHWHSCSSFICCASCFVIAAADIICNIDIGYCIDGNWWNLVKIPLSANTSHKVHTLCWLKELLCKSLLILFLWFRVYNTNLFCISDWVMSGYWLQLRRLSDNCRSKPWSCDPVIISTHYFSCLSS